MKQSEVLAVAKETAIYLFNGGYIKGYGVGKYRVMDKDHNPVKNIDKDVFTQLQLNELIELNNLVYNSVGNLDTIVIKNMTYKKL